MSAMIDVQPLVCPPASGGMIRSISLRRIRPDRVLVPRSRGNRGTADRAIAGPRRRESGAREAMGRGDGDCMRGPASCARGARR